MLKSTSNRSTNRNGGVLNNSTHRHRRSMPILFKSSRSAKKQLSLILNKADFEICQVPDENEMHEYMNNSHNQGNNNTNNTDQSDSTIADDTITDQQQQSLNIYPTSPTNPKSHLLSHIKHRFGHSKKDPNDQEKNRGFILINQVNGDLVSVTTDHTDLQHTRHPEPCEHGQIDEDTVDVDQIELQSITPVTPDLVPPPQTSIAVSILPIINRSNSETDIQATQAGVECGTSNVEETNNPHDTQVSTTNSSSSTNSSNHDPRMSTIDRSILSDAEFVSEQKRDLERITVYEIALNDDRREYLQDLPQNENDELEFNHLYTDALQLNLKLKEELKQLQEQNSRIYAPWSCEVCTYINDPFIKTRRDVCEMCEGPSPLKRHTLTS